MATIGALRCVKWTTKKCSSTEYEEHKKFAEYKTKFLMLPFAIFRTNSHFWKENECCKAAYNNRSYQSFVAWVAERLFCLLSIAYLLGK